jgi:hypothetical protein
VYAPGAVQDNNRPASRRQARIPRLPHGAGRTPDRPSPRHPMLTSFARADDVDPPLRIDHQVLGEVVVAADVGGDGAAIAEPDDELGVGGVAERAPPRQDRRRWLHRQRRRHRVRVHASKSLPAMRASPCRKSQEARHGGRWWLDQTSPSARVFRSKSHERGGGKRFLCRPCGSLGHASARRPKRRRGAYGPDRRRGVALARPPRSSWQARSSPASQTWPVVFDSDHVERRLQHLRRGSFVHKAGARSATCCNARSRLSAPGGTAENPPRDPAAAAGPRRRSRTRPWRPRSRCRPVRDERLLSAAGVAGLIRPGRLPGGWFVS